MLAETKICSSCFRVLPVDRFRVRKQRGKPGGWCRDCHAAYMREYRRAKRVREVCLFVSQTRRANSLEAMAGLVNGTMARLGGIDHFCQTWAESLKTATPTMRLRGFTAIGKMLMMLESQKPAACARKQDESQGNRTPQNVTPVFS
jgi:hypothetical protein